MRVTVPGHGYTEVVKDAEWGWRGKRNTLVLKLNIKVMIKFNPFTISFVHLSRYSHQIFYLYYVGRAPSTKMKKLTTELIDTQDCNRIFRELERMSGQAYYPILEKQNLCAGGKEGNYEEIYF